MSIKNYLARKMYLWAIAFMNRNGYINGRWIRGVYVCGRDLHIVNFMNPFIKVDISDIELAMEYFGTSIIILEDSTTTNLPDSFKIESGAFLFERKSTC